MTHHSPNLRATLPTYQPDTVLLDHGDAAIRDAILAYVNAGLSDEHVAARVLAGLSSLVELVEVPEPLYQNEAAWAVAWPCARSGMAPTRLASLMVKLSRIVPGWPTSRDEIGAVIRQAYREAARS